VFGWLTTGLYKTMTPFEITKIVITSYFEITLGLLLALQNIKENLQFQIANVFYLLVFFLL
jgi:hypothetical protein